MSGKWHLCVGSGFAGSVVARELAEAGHRCLVIDQRSHVGGNCYTQRDPDTGVTEHVYGPHIFNTNDRALWDYVGRYCVMRPFINRVKADTSRGVFSFPINLHTINQFFGLKLTPAQAVEFIATKRDRTIEQPRNFEEQALQTVGRELYETFLYGYTRKQWGCEPRELSADALKRLPVRFNYNDAYYDTLYQGIPEEGYTSIITKLLDHPNIELKLQCEWQPAMSSEFIRIFYTGTIDSFYGLRFGRLGYRTVFWHRATYNGDYQGNAVINYPEMGPPHTRIHEHKHFAPWESHQKTLVLTEFSKETGTEDDPYYPKRLRPDLETLEKYHALSQLDPKVTFLGRLGTYRYLNMDAVIGQAIRVARDYLSEKA
jgi:UDP-galactopyranose mutase